MKIKGKAFGKFPVTIVDIYDDDSVLWAICITENGAIVEYEANDLKIIDDDYLPKEENNELY